MSRYRYLIIILLVAIGFGSAFLSGYFLRAYFEDATYELPILNQAFDIFINHSFLELPGSRALEYGMIRGMLQASGDPYAIFLEPVQHELETNSLQGSFGGIGVELTLSSEGNIVVFPIANSPAHQAGIQDGDRLISVGDLQIGPTTSIDEINAAIRGPIGDLVKVVVSRKPEFTPIEFQIPRQEIHLPSVTWRIDPDNPTVGIVNPQVIAESTPREILNAIQELKAKGATHFVIDLRDNGGGLLTAGVETARLFLDDGIIMEQQYRGEEIETFAVNVAGPLRDIPLVVLVNQSTASSAEIIAGSIQHHDRGLLIGEPTFGKDSIQLIFDLEDDSSLHVTAAKWWFPGNTVNISENGLQPDVLITKNDSDSDLIMKIAIQSLLEQP